MIILELWLRKELKAKLALSRPILGSKKRKEREQKVREKQEENKGETRKKQEKTKFKAIPRYFLAYFDLSSHFEDMVMIP